MRQEPVIILDGREVATPAWFVTRDGHLYGYFLAGDGLEYDEMMYWGEDTPAHRAAIQEAGVYIEEED